MAGVSWLLWTAAAPAFVELSIQGDQLSLCASNASLREVLGRFARSGVSVQMDPLAEGQITATLRNRPVEDALPVILKSFDYVIFWDVVRGPLGDWPKLSEIQVFPRGQRSATLQKIARGGATNAPANARWVADEMILRLRPGVGLAAFKDWLGRLGATLLDGLPDLDLYRIRLPEGATVEDFLRRLAGDAMIAAAEPNYYYRLPPMNGAANGGTEALAPGQPATKGAPALAILDSGFMAGLPGTEGLLAGWLDASQPGAPVSDTLGHGTQMALLAAGWVEPGGLDDPASGSSPPLLAIRAFDDTGRATSFGLLQAIQFARDNGARVLNLSWGAPEQSGFLLDAVQKARANGAVVVASAGNEPTGRPVYPAAYPGVVSVAALGADGNLWPSSNYGSFVHYAAPGTAILPVGYRGGPGSYAGTSIAGAVVSRALALYFQRHPTATADEAISALERATSAKRLKSASFSMNILDSAALRRLLK